jgi:two-component system, cell cycle sensor histidine kinase and response regulator CckA
VNGEARTTDFIVLLYSGNPELALPFSGNPKMGNIQVRHMPDKRTLPDAVPEGIPHLAIIDCSEDPQGSCSLISSLKAGTGFTRLRILAAIAKDSPDSLFSVIRAGADDYMEIPAPGEAVEFKVGKNLEILGQMVLNGALEKSEDEYRLLAERSNALLCEIDKEGRILYVNATVKRLLGYEPEELIGKSAFEIGDPSEFGLSTRALRKAAAENDFQQNIWRFYDKGGKVHYLSIYSYTRIDAEGRTRINTLGFDLTDRITAEEKLAESEKKFREIVELFPLGIFEIDAEGDILFVNSRMFDYFGYDREDLGKSLTNISQTMDPEETERAFHNYGRILRGEVKLGNNVYTCKTKDGTSFPAQVMLIPIFTGNRVTGSRGILTDISDKMRLENEIQRVQKLESLGILAGGIAHDFNNILTGIRATLSMLGLMIEPLKQDDFAEYIKDADKAVMRAVSLTRQLLTFAKGGAPVKKKSRLQEIIRDSSEFVLRGSASKCYYDFSPDLWAAEVDREQFGQVIQNIVINAIQAMPAGGKIDITARNHDNAAHTNPILDARQKYIRIDIGDQGSGIPETILNNIFDSYFSTKKTGTGLGLSICHSIISRHGGTIEVSQAGGKGAKFSLYLPAATDSAPIQEEKVPAPECAPPASVRRVLYMDDEECVLNAAQKILARFGIGCDITSNGEEAIKRYLEAKANGASYDAVILDLTIPDGMGGRETVKKLLEADPGAVAIVSSGYSNDPVMSDYGKYGFRGVLPKPFDVTTLLESLSNAVKSGKD